MQPFQLPRPNTIPGGARPGVPRPGMPGPQQGARPGVPRPGMPGPMGVKPQIPSNIGVNHPVTNQIPQEEKPKEPVETIQQEPVQEEVPEQKAEPIKTEPPVKTNRPGPPQFGGQKPMPKIGMKAGPPFGQPPSQPITKQPEIPTKQAEPEPVSQRKPSLKPEIEPPQQKPPLQQEVEQIPQRKPSYKQEVEPIIPQRKPSFQPEPQVRNEPPVQVQESHQSGGGDYSNDRLLRLSESLQAMKDLRSNFQGFNPAEEEEQEEQYGEEEEYAEEDDYVRVEGTEDEEGLGDAVNEGQRYSDENQEEEEFEDNQNQQDYPEEEDYEPEAEDQGNSESQNQLAEPHYPAQIIQEDTPEETPKAHIEASPERKFPPPMAKTLPQVGAFGMRPSPHGSAGLRPPGSAGIQQPVGSAGIKPQSAGIQPKAQTSAGRMNSPFREEKPLIHHQPQHRSKYATESQELLTSHEEIRHGSGKKDSDYERIEHEAAAISGRNDPNLILKLERLELELEKEKKKSALLEEQQEQVLNENQSLKQRNAELTARLELASKRTATSEQSSSHPESDALREELTRSLEETRQISENAQRMMQEAAQYREESESFISKLESEKNDLYQQVVQLKRQIDEDYVHQIESYKQRTDLLERKIKDHENNFNMVTGQLREKSSTIQKITSLNTEIQSALSTLHEPFSSELLYQSRDFNLLPHDFTTKSNQKSVDFPRPQAEVIHKEEPKPPVDSGKKQQQQEEKVSGEAFMAPPQSRLPNKAKKEEQPKPQAVPFKAPPQLQTQPKQPENISIIHYEESKPSPSPSKLIAGKSKLHAKTNKNPFADEEEPLESPNVVDESAVNYDQQFIEEPAQQHYAEEQGYTEGGQDEPLDEIDEAQDFFNGLSQQAQKEIHSGGLLNTSKQSKSSLRYSANQVPGETTENQGGALTQEAAENFFDQLGNSPNPESPQETPTQIRTDPYQYNQPKPQVQAKPVQKGTNPFADEAEEEAPPVSQPQKQVHQHQQAPPKKVVQSSVQKGKNPFADEEEDSSSQFQVPPPQTRQVPQQTAKQLPPPRNIVPTSSHKGTNPFAEENEPEPVQAKPVVRATPQRGKNPFDNEEETSAQGSEFFQQPKTQVPPQNIPQNRAQQQPFPKPGQPKAAIKRGNNPFADEEEEKNVQPQVQTQPQVRTQPPVQQYQQPPAQSKPVSRGPIQKGNNPFADESEGQNPFDTPEAGSFVDRPEVQRPNQPKTLPLQTGVAKKLDVQPSKGSALKKAKGVIPSSMFD